MLTPRGALRTQKLHPVWVAVQEGRLEFAELQMAKRAPGEVVVRGGFRNDVRLARGSARGGDAV